MKTKFYLTTLLALIIQVMVKSQTPVNPTQDYSEQFLIGGNSQKLNMKNTNALRELILKSDELYSQFQELRGEAKLLKGKKQNQLFEEAKTIYQEYEVIQIETSELSAKVTYEKFNLNSLTLKAMLIGNQKDIDILDYVQNLIMDAEAARKMAIEMREEAYAEPNNTSKLGVMGNAEEQELIAIHKQIEAFYLLQKPSFGVAMSSLPNKL